MSTTTRQLIVNADDFGQSFGINRGIIRAYEHGIVTSASLMVRWPAAAEAAAFAQSNPGLSLGLHIDLGEWVYRDETWEQLYQVVPMDDHAAVADKVARQLDQFQRLAGRNPTHLDSHQHVHRSEPAYSVVSAISQELAIPLRHYTPTVRYCGNFYGQTGKGLPIPGAISVDSLIGILRALPPGCTELGCHPGEGDDITSMYRDERTEEQQTLCDPRVRAALLAEAIELCSFHQKQHHKAP
jgi:chitin disaccharide deacetylase